MAPVEIGLLNFPWQWVPVVVVGGDGVESSAE
jgi:hypothetical protein